MSFAGDIINSVFENKREVLSAKQFEYVRPALNIVSSGSYEYKFKTHDGSIMLDRDIYSGIIDNYNVKVYANELPHKKDTLPRYTYSIEIEELESRISFIERENREKAAKAAIKKETYEKMQNSKHIGNVGERLEFTLTLNNVFKYETNFGTRFIFQFIDDEYNVFIWQTYNEYEYELGEVCTFKGTIKDHGEYKGIKQTILTRCRF